MADIHRETRRRIDETSDDLIDLARDLVAIPSVTGQEGAVQEFVAETFCDTALEPDVWEPDPEQLRDHPGYFETSSFQDHGYAGRPNVAAIREGSGDGPVLGLSGHVDVVSVDEAAWTYDPWSPVVDSGRLYGRGSADMKGGIAAFIHAVRTLDEMELELRGDVLLQTTIEEEAGGVGGMLSAIERGYQPDAAIITEPYQIPNIGIASAGVMYFRVTIEGRASHAARGYKGVNAIGKASAIYDALDALDRERKARISYEPVVNRTPEAEGEVTNLNVGTIKGGGWPSTVPRTALLEGRIGWPPGETRREVRRQVEDAIASVVRNDEWLQEHPPDIEWFGWSADPHEVDRTADIVQLAKRHAEDVTDRSGQFIGGDAGLDERFYNRYYDIPCPTVGPYGDNLHGADEYVEIDSLVETAQTVASVALDFCGVETE